MAAFQFTTCGNQAALLLPAWQARTPCTTTSTILAQLCCLQLAADLSLTMDPPYDPWGNVTSHTGTTLQPYQYVGQLGYYTHYQDTSLNLLQLGVRFYERNTARFAQVDPIGDALNGYAYADGNPVAHIDPWGLASLVRVYVDSIYNSGPWEEEHMWLNEHVADSFSAIVSDVKAASKGKGSVRISDMLRSWDEQADVCRRKPGCCFICGQELPSIGTCI